MARLKVGDMVTGLVLVRLGQELGTQSPLSKAVYDLALLVISFARF